MSYTLTFFLEPDAFADQYSSDSALMLLPEGTHAHTVNLQFPTRVTPEQRVVIADKIAAVVQRWRDNVAEAARQQRTTADELAAAREEIARLKAERGDES